MPVPINTYYLPRNLLFASDNCAYAMTDIIGNRLAKAINPKPSINGLLPGTVSAKPNPSAATNGTVTVEVVTPPES